MESAAQPAGNPLSKWIERRENASVVSAMIELFTESELFIESLFIESLFIETLFIQTMTAPRIQN